MPKAQETVNIIGRIAKVVRDSKNAKVTLEIPSAQGIDIPVGEVKVTIELVQKEILFPSKKDKAQK